MQMKAYRSLRKLTLQKVADATGQPHASSVRRHEEAMMFPRPEIVDRYRDFTQGAVTEADWMENWRARVDVPPTSLPEASEGSPDRAGAQAA